MEAHIVTAQYNHTSSIPTFTAKQLQAADYHFTGPFQLLLSNGEFLLVDEVVRLIPGRRMVVFGWWQHKPVAAKLFYAGKHAIRQMEKDAKGVKFMRDNKVPTPALYFQGYLSANTFQQAGTYGKHYEEVSTDNPAFRSSQNDIVCTTDATRTHDAAHTVDKSVCVLIFERILEAKNLDEIWQEKLTVHDIYPQLQAVIVELATQHVLGILQHDLHLKNFLLTEKTVYTLDGAQIELQEEKLSKKLSMDNLALFLSQFGVGMEKYQEDLFKYYANARGWILKPDDVPELFFAIRQWNEERWQRYQKKIFRHSTDFYRIKNWRVNAMICRVALMPEFSQIVKHPDTAFQHPSAVILKAGRSSTVVKVTLDNRDYVVKRYNLKNTWHQLRRCLRATRAMMSWRLAQKLNLFGVNTASPIAFIEKRFFGLRGKSYYISEYVAGEHIGNYFKQYQHQDENISLMIDRVTILLKNIAKLEMTHGDLKMTNILVNAYSQPVLIDLDGTVEHFSISSLDKAWRKEIKRFLRNFEGQPDVLEKLRQAL